MTESNRMGFRGYICARMEMGRSAPQHIQQMVMREYCNKNNMVYLLAAVEYRMPGCTMILDAVLGELDHIEGIVMYSLYLFPSSRAKRMEMYTRIFEKGCALHTAAEGIVIRNLEDAMRIEESLLVHEAIRDQSEKDFNYLTQWDRNAAA